MKYLLICHYVIYRLKPLKSGIYILKYIFHQYWITYIEECGRAGRCGRESTCILLYNGHLSNHCSSDIKEYIEGYTCRKQQILKHFPIQHEVTARGCTWCDVCAKKYNCSALVVGILSCWYIWTSRDMSAVTLFYFQMFIVNLVSTIFFMS